MQIKDWQTLTVGDYQRIFTVANRYAQAGQRSITQEDADAEIVAVLTAQPIEEVDRLKVWEFKRILEEARGLLENIPDAPPARRIKVPGFGWMAIQYRVTEIDGGQYNELMNFSRGENSIIFNVHLILATLAQPVRRTWWGKWKTYPRDTRAHAEIAEAFKNVRFLHAYQAAVFFCLIFRCFWDNSLTYLRQQLKTGKIRPDLAEAVTRTLADFSKITDGYMPPVKWPRSKISHWNRFGVYRYCSILTAYNT
jgi:hypothetical protein